MPRSLSLVITLLLAMSWSAPVVAGNFTADEERRLLGDVSYESEDGEIANCVVEPSAVVEVSSRIDGILETVGVERGDWIAAGSVVARLEAGVERAALRQAEHRAQMTAEVRANEVSFDYGQRSFERISELNARKLASEDEIERARSEADVAKHRLQQSRDNKRLAELELARTREVLDRHTILSPINGVVVERFLSPGETTEDKPVVRLAQLDPLRVELVLPASEYGKVAVGDSGLVKVETDEETEYDARVIIVDPIVDAASSTFRITLELPNPERDLTSGLRCTASLHPNRESLAEIAPELAW